MTSGVKLYLFCLTVGWQLGPGHESFSPFHYILEAKRAGHYFITMGFSMCKFRFNSDG
jgi:hypothetical protein